MTMSTDGSPTLQSSYRSLANPTEFEDFLSGGEALAARLLITTTSSKCVLTANLLLSKLDNQLGILMFYVKKM